MSGPITPPLTVTTASGTPSGRPITTIKVSDGDLTISGNVATIDTSGSGGVPGGSTTQIQYNNAGAFGGSADFTFSDIGAALPKINILSSTTANKAILSPSTFKLDGGTAAGVLTTTDADDGLILHTGTEGITGPSLYLDTDTSPSQALLQNQTTDGTITIQTTAGDGDITVDANGDLNLYGDTIVYLRHQAAGQVEVRSATDTPAILQVKTVGDGVPSINLTDDTRAITIKCDANQKLKVEGANTFVFDASSATGGITFPDTAELISAEGTAILATGITDGYVLTADGAGASGWEAAGGGGSSYNQARNPNADLYTGYTTYLISRGVGFTTVGAMTTTVETRTNYRQISFRPFIAPQSGDLTAFLAYVSTAGAATDISLGIYDDDGGAPNDLMGTATIDCSSTGSKTQTSISATITLVEGTQYWYSWVTTNSTDSPGLRAEDQDYTQFASNQTNSIAGTDSQQYIIDVLATANTSPASITRTNLYPAGGNSGGNPRIGVQF